MCDNNAKSARTLPFPHRPFLRRQESQSIKGGIAASNPPPKLPPTQSPKSPTNLPSSLRPFLRRQESHSVVCANNDRFAHNCPFPPQLIPAKAGISKGNALPRQIWRHDTVRFLLPQEWSTGERESIGKYGIVAARRQLSPNPPNPPNCHRRIRQNRHPANFPHCRRRHIAAEESPFYAVFAQIANGAK